MFAISISKRSLTALGKKIGFHQSWHSTRVYLVAAVIQDFAEGDASTGIG